MTMHFFYTSTLPTQQPVILRFFLTVNKHSISQYLPSSSQIFVITKSLMPLCHYTAQSRTDRDEILSLNVYVIFYL